MKKIILILIILFPSVIIAQNTIHGNVIDTEGNPLKFATVALLNADSTLAHFCITNDEGTFKLDKIPSDEFLMQVAHMGFETYHKNLKVPVADNKIGSIILKESPIGLDEVTVTADRIPILIKSDTVEYNAAAFKTKPDAVAEDLLKKLPGVEVDRSGNIKAMGEDVNKVLVDGKEFFSSDPKVATKNLPAESLDKVQVYDKKSDESEFLGIDDSEYDKTINFVLKDDMKQAIFGDVKLGGGAKDYYIGNTKVYRFTEKHQFAVLGMINNVNRPGFSFQDYLDFNGGIRSLMSSGGGSISFNTNDGIPVNFGQSVTGEIMSGAGGINYSYEFAKNNRFNISYMGNHTDNDSKETSQTRHFTDDNTFEQNSDHDGNQINTSHLLNFGWRNKSNAQQHFMLNGIVTLSDGESNSNTFTQSYNNGDFINSVTNNSVSTSNMIKTFTEGSLLRKGRGQWKMLKLNGDFRYNLSLSESGWENLTQFSGNISPFEEDQLLNKQNKFMEYHGKFTGLRKLARGLYIEPSIKAGLTDEITDREQGHNQAPFIALDSMSMELDRKYQMINPSLRLKYYAKNKKHNIIVGLAYELGAQENTLVDSSSINQGIDYLLPSASWSYDYKSNRRVDVSYRTFVILPTSSQLMPIINNSNPMALYYGNRMLEPEYKHSAHLSWFMFDTYSFTSIFTNLSASYTQNKINQSIMVDDDLRQTISLVNVPEDYRVSLGLNFSTPIRPLGIKVKLGINESWNKGLSYVNNIRNINTNLSHRVKLSFDNRKKDKWDVEVGGKIAYTDAQYSIQSELNREYFNYSGFGEVRFTPTDKWHFRITGDVVNYDAQGFSEEITVPLLSAEINYYFMKNKRAMITLEGADLLNKNTGISRISELNYMREVNANTIGRYILLSLKFKLNKFGSDHSSGIQIKLD